MTKAIISVSDKNNLAPFSKELVKLGFTIYSTGGTLTFLQDNKIEVQSIKSLTQFPEILDGRVKTLHPHIHAGILADKSKKSHLKTCDEHSIQLIDLVVVNLYPFEKTIAEASVTENDAIENIDIGGPTLIRAAAKNFNSTSVVVDSSQYDAVIEELKVKNNVLSKQTRKNLAIEAFHHVAKYDIAIANYFQNFKDRNVDGNSLPHLIHPTLEKVNDLRYGENPHQQAALYKYANAKEQFFKQLHGKELSYNNFLDIASAINIVKGFDLPGAAVIKHTNPCGAAIGDSLCEAYKKAHDADSLSAFGSIVGLNRPIDKQTADELSKTFIEVIVAPSFDEDAFKILSKKNNLRLIEAKQAADQDRSLTIKHIGDFFLVQTDDDLNFLPENLDNVTTIKASKKQVNDLLFAFSLVKHVKSNAILIAKDGQTLGIGAGQMSRVDSVEIALKKAGDFAKTAVMASDAFFPFKDSVELCATYGISAIIQPGGSKRDQESIDCCNEHGIAMIFTGSRHFKH